MQPIGIGEHPGGDRTAATAPRRLGRRRSSRLVMAALLALLTLPGLVAAAPPAAPGVLRLVFAGDTYFGETFVGADIAGGKALPGPEAGPRAAAALQPLVRGADAVILNLETPLTHRDISPLAGRKDYLHRGHPEASLQALQALGASAVSLANNHAMDYGEAGLADTLAALRGQGIAVFGAGNGPRQAATPWSRRWQTPAGDLTVIVATGYEYNRRYDTHYDTYAEPGDEGVNLWTPDTARAQMLALRAAWPRAVIVAFPHGGDNYAWRDDLQVRLHDALIDAGADLVLGHGAHLAQEIAGRRGRWIVHGLGNAVFNTPGRYTEVGQHSWSLVAALLLQPQGAGLRLGLRLYPIRSDNQTTGYLPQPVGREEAERLARLLMWRARGLGQRIVLRPALDAWGWHFPLDLGTRALEPSLTIEPKALSRHQN